MKSRSSLTALLAPAVALLASAAALLLMPAVEAAAQGRPVLIVPFERENIDDAFYARFMEQIRTDAAESDLYEPLPKVDRPMSELLFEVGCAEPQPECLQLIGESFGAEVIIYGEIARNDRRALETVQAVDLLTGASVLDVPIELALEADDDEQLFRKLIGNIQQIFFPYTGKLTVSTSEPGAEILFDGQKVGDTNAGPVTVSERALGEHAVTARIGDREVSQSVTLVRGQTAEVLIDMSQPVVEGGIPYLGTYIALGIGGVGLIGGGVFSFLTSSAQSRHDELLDKLNKGQPLSKSESEEVSTVLSNGKTFTIVQFVLYGIGAAAVGTGAVLYFLEGEESAPAGEAFFSPQIGPDNIGATVGFSF